MALTVTHATTVAVPDDGTSPIGSDEWNATHNVTGVLDFSTQFPSGSAGTVLTSNGSVASFTPNISFPAGTAAIAPLDFAAGVNLTTAASGSWEFDGTCFYATTVASDRGVLATERFISLLANQAGANVNTAQTWFPGGGQTQFTVPGSTSFFFEGVLALSRSAGTTSHTISLLFGGTATFTSINYVATVTDQAASTPSLSSPQVLQVAAATATAITGATANAAQYNTIHVRGIMRINAGGTLIPEFIYSAAPGGAPTVQANSWLRMRPIGSNSVIFVGNCQ